jgi:hypothetical protein
VGVTDAKGVGAKKVFVGMTSVFAITTGVPVASRFVQETSIINRRRGNLRFIEVP